MECRKTEKPEIYCCAHFFNRVVGKTRIGIFSAFQVDWSTVKKRIWHAHITQQINKWLYDTSTASGIKTECQTCERHMENLTRFQLSQNCGQSRIGWSVRNQVLLGMFENIFRTSLHAGILGQVWTEIKKFWYVVWEKEGQRQAFHFETTLKRPQRSAVDVWISFWHNYRGIHVV